MNPLNHKSLKFKLVSFSVVLAVVSLILCAAILVRQSSDAMHGMIRQDLAGTANDVVRMVKVEEKGIVSGDDAAAETAEPAFGVSRPGAVGPHRVLVARLDDMEEF